jgi:hypothetical protein
MTCAICTSTTGPFRLEPLGRNDALVHVCHACSSEPPRAFVHSRIYEPSGGLPSVDEIAAGARRAMGDERYERDARREIEYGKSPSHALTDAEVMDNQRRHDGIRRARTRVDARTVRSRERKLY